MTDDQLHHPSGHDRVLQIISADFSGFNQKTLKLKPLVDAALDSFDIKIRGILLNASNSKLSAQITKDIEKFKKAQNQYSDDFVSIDFLDLKGINDLARAVPRAP